MKYALTLGLSLMSVPLWAIPINSDQSRIDFTIKQMNVPIQGQFKNISGDIVFDAAHATQGKADLTIPIANMALPTKDAMEQAKHADWFNSARYPTAHFITTSMKALGNNRFQFSGKLTIKGTTQDVSAPFTLSQQGKLMMADGTVPISRLAFKIGEGEWADTDTVADTVFIKFHIAFPPSK